MHIIDCSGMLCPQPVINTKKYFDSIESGSAEVIVDNEVSKSNVKKFADSKGYISSVSEKEGKFHIEITKGEGITCEPMSFNETLTIVITSSKLGEGDDQLGETLMKSYIFALSEGDITPTNIIFMNSGVKLTVEGSNCLEGLNKLLDKGSRIMSCGTCLDFYGLKEKLVIGDISNMYTIVEEMNKSTKTINI
ncbi:sulfurtransferase-like selenium metabolism protein YedF [Clostridium polynesiense]|uniref:sulfurtransferase-like selenium metabolism protein YedF n=1 Tax=Clostridium polynesiense TaxID=1325933 RepID=UPI00058F5605|nr:sulfurtransferase-like selenium metabolism protein YedF [Clostridium polynesiense]